jgi:predicted alpha/beta superfamily hydrolase
VARIYLDVGGREHHGERIRRAYLDGLAEMTELLRRKGYGDDSLRAVVDEEAPHHESAWAARFPETVRFLLAPS